MFKQHLGREVLKKVKKSYTNGRWNYSKTGFVTTLVRHCRTIAVKKRHKIIPVLTHKRDVSVQDSPELVLRDHRIVFQTEIAAAVNMRIIRHDRPQPAAHGKIIGLRYRILELMPVILLFFHSNNIFPTVFPTVHPNNTPPTLHQLKTQLWV